MICRTVKVCILMPLIVAVFIGCTTESMAQTTLIKQTTLVTATEKREPRTLKGPRNVLIKNGRIVAIDTDNKAYPGAAVIDGKGLFLSPGLIDSHVHLEGVPGYRANAPSSQEGAMLEAAQAQIPRSYLYHGFTTLLDLASDAASIQKWNQQPLAPKAYFCGATPIANGYPLSWMDPAEQFDHPMAENLLFEPSHAHAVPSKFHTEAHQPKALAQKIKASGALCIKAYYEEGFGAKKGLPVPAVQTVKALVNAAHANGLKLYLHGNSSRAHQFAIEAGVDVLAHGLWHNQKQEGHQIEKNVAKNGMALQPTLSVIHGELAMFDPDFFQQEDIKRFMPKALIQWYQSDSGQWMKNNLMRNFPADNGSHDSPQALYQRVAKGYAEAFDNLEKNTNSFVANGGNLVFGSDTPSGPFYTQFPGYNGWQEIKLWQKIGISPAQIFRALTLDNAKLLGLESQLGSIEVGKQADLLLLKNNPLISVDAYNEIEWVILNGKVIRRSELQVRP